VWPDEVDDVLGGDLTCAIAYVTPARGAVVTAVAPIGLRDRDAGTVGFTTSLGFGRKLERLREEPRIAMAYHARDHGIGDGANRRYVLVQGRATFDPDPDQDYLEREIGPRATRYLGEPRRGFFWDRWLEAYYADRVLVSVDVERIVAWPELDAAGEPVVVGAARPQGQPDPQAPPKKGTAPRVDATRAGRRADALPHRLVAYVEADGYPVILPFDVRGVGPDGVRIATAVGLPPGGRRAGIVAHRYRPQLIGLETHVHTGWLEAGDGDALYSPHTEGGFRAPANKTLLLLGNGFMARRNLAKARKQGRVVALRGPS
jgi:hypothetical protein